jgi:hypothetical protein
VKGDDFDFSKYHLNRFNPNSGIVSDPTFIKLRGYIKRFYEGNEHRVKESRAAAVYRTLQSLLLQI